MHRRAQPSRGRGDLYAVAGHPGRDEGAPRPAERYRVDPVAAGARVPVLVRRVRDVPGRAGGC
ncbi:hypothetical protein ACWEOA_18495, partial [Streptomyces sp. NPDC004457]